MANMIFNYNPDNMVYIPYEERGSGSIRYSCMDYECAVSFYESQGVSVSEISKKTFISLIVKAHFLDFKLRSFVFENTMERTNRKLKNCLYNFSIMKNRNILLEQIARFGVDVQSFQNYTIRNLRALLIETNKEKTRILEEELSYRLSVRSIEEQPNDDPYINNYNYYMNFVSDYLGRVSIVNIATANMEHNEIEEILPFAVANIENVTTLQHNEIEEAERLLREEKELMENKRLNCIHNNCSEDNCLCENCPICYETIGKSKVVLKCGHLFCVKCIFRHFNNSNKCPMCRGVYA